MAKICKKWSSKSKQTNKHDNSTNMTIELGALLNGPLDGVSLCKGPFLLDPSIAANVTQFIYLS